MSSNDLRVISGEFKGAKIISPDSGKTHPMGAREKLALFNMVNPANEKVLDAYAGSGALGIEALSRGAESVVFVEKSPRIMQVLRENLANIQSRNREKTLKIEFFTKSVRNFAQNPEFFEKIDLILADPPYDKIDLTEIQELVKLLSSNGQLVLSSPAEQEAPELAGIELSSSRTYARARLSIYRKN